MRSWRCGLAWNLLLCNCPSSLPFNLYFSPFTFPPLTLPLLLIFLLILLLVLLLVLFLFLFLFSLYFLYSSLYSSAYPTSPLFFFLFLLPFLSSILLLIPPLPLRLSLPLLQVYKESPDVYYSERNRPPTWSHRSNNSPEFVASYCLIAPNPAPKNSEKTVKNSLKTLRF